jgi:hypothetical protein
MKEMQGELAWLDWCSSPKIDWLPAVESRLFSLKTQHNTTQHGASKGAR